MSFYDETNVKRTRKNCLCQWCWERIDAGEPSVITAGVFDGEFQTARYHPECRRAIMAWYDINKCHGEPLPDYEMIRGGIREKRELESNQKTK
jgi:hypothetical protein